MLVFGALAAPAKEESQLSVSLLGEGNWSAAYHNKPIMLYSIEGTK